MYFTAKHKCCFHHVSVSEWKIYDNELFVITDGKSTWLLVSPKGETKGELY